MKLYSKIFLIYLLAFMAVQVSAKTQLPFSIGEWSPMTGKNLPGYGIASEIVTAACEAADLEPQFSFYPWLRAELYVKQGRSFATFPYAEIDERKTDFIFSNTILSSSVSILRLKKSARTENFVYNGIKDLAGYSVGTTVGSLRITSPLNENGVHYEETDNLDISMRKLAAGRIDFVIDSEIAIIDAMHRLYNDSTGQFEFLKKDFAPRMHYKLMISKNYPDSENLVKKFNEGLSIISANGKLKKIYLKYGIER